MSTPPVRNLGQAEPGQGLATSPSVRRQLAVSLLKVTGVVGRGMTRKGGRSRG